MPSSVLIIEDSVRHGQILAAIMRTSGLTPVLAHSIDIARDALRMRQWHLVVLSLYGGHTNVMSRLAEVKALAGRTPLAIVTATEESSPDHLTAALNYARRGPVQLLLPGPFRTRDVEAGIRQVDARLAARNRLAAPECVYVE